VTQRKVYAHTDFEKLERTLVGTVTFLVMRATYYQMLK